MAREATPGVSRVPEVSIPVGGRCYSADASTHQTTPDAQPERRTCPTVSTYNQTPAADDDPDFVDPYGYHHYALVPQVYLAGEESA